MTLTQRSTRSSTQTEQTYTSSTDSSRHETPVESVVQPLRTETIHRARQDPQRLSSVEVLQLQRAVGNQAVQRLLADRGSAPPNGVAPGRRDGVIQRVTDYDDDISGYVTGKDSGTALQSKAGGIQDYMKSLNTKGIRGWRKRRQQRKTLRNVLDLGPEPNEEWGAEAHTLIRSILVAELASGQDERYVRALREVLLSVVQQQDKHGMWTIKNWYDGSAKHLNDIREIIRDAWPQLYNREFLNWLGRHNSGAFENGKEELGELEAALRMTQQNIKDVPTYVRQDDTFRDGERYFYEAMEHYTEADLAWIKRRWYDMDISIKRSRELYLQADIQLRGASALKSRKHVPKRETGQSEKVGGGQFSEVQKIQYGTPRIKMGYRDRRNEEPTGTKWYFKSEQREYNKGDARGAYDAGIPTLGSNLSNRAVAAYRLDQLFGFGLVPKTEFAVHEGTFGTVMEEAKGKAPQKHVGFVFQYRDFDLSDFEILRGLSGLQLFDAITGQVDRHHENYLIEQGDDTETRIHAIDNDFAFGVKNKDTSKPSSRDDKYKGLPLFVDYDLAQRVLRVTDDQVRAVIAPLLRPAEVQVTILRFNQVKDHLRKLEKNTRELDELKQLLRDMRDVMNDLQEMGDNVDKDRSEIENSAKAVRTELLQKGALLRKDEWTDEIAALHTAQNSYYGHLKSLQDKARTENKIVPVDSD
jgi:hypothetical protein